MIAALYIDPRGPYVGRPDVDAWDERRDATRYEGPHPVVAHPPCRVWGPSRHLSRAPVEERALALRAVEQVRRWGGVLEHPRGSTLWGWPGLNLPGPGELPDAWGGRSIEVQQVDWGHVARKPTWLYLVGVRELGTLPGRGTPTHWCSGGRNAPRGAVPPGIKVASVRQRRRTPPRFADWLIWLARQAAR